jgi:hypothetical protein
MLTGRQSDFESFGGSSNLPGATIWICNSSVECLPEEEKVACSIHARSTLIFGTNLTLKWLLVYGKE